MRRLHVVRYERLVADPDAALAPVFAAIGLTPCPVAALVRPGIDDRYFARWRAARNPVRRLDRDRAVDRLEDAVARFGYSLVDLERSEPGTMLAGLSS